MSRSKKQMHRRPMTEQALPFKEAEPTQAQLARTHLSIAQAHLTVALAAIARELAASPELPALFSSAAEVRKSLLEVARDRVLQLSEEAEALRSLLLNV